VFEHHGLWPNPVPWSFDAMSEIPVPVYVFPGRHDPLPGEALSRSEIWQRECRRNVSPLCAA
jgi:hypothetical protein